MSSYKGRPLGSFGHLAAISFHETKSVISGERGALLVNQPMLIERAEIMREKGTDRSRFFRVVDKYRWVDVGFSYLPSETNSSVSLGTIGSRARTYCDAPTPLDVWMRYQLAFAGLESDGLVRRPVIFPPPDATHNGHLYYLIVPSAAIRSAMLAELNARGIRAIFSLRTVALVAGWTQVRPQC